MTRRRITLAVTAVALLVPLIRFGPRYAILARDLLTARESPWSDAVLDRDSRTVSTWLRANKQPGDTLLVWGYRPDVFAYTRMPMAGLFWDSQPLTGVPADRHLGESTSLMPEWAARNRRELTQSHPTFIVDGLSRLNPKLAINRYPELQDWLNGYKVVTGTDLTTVYKRIPAVALASLPVL